MSGGSLEEWRPVVGWDTHYQVSSLGNVRRIAKGPGTRPNRYLKPQPRGKGYLVVYLSKLVDGVVFRTSYSLHILVARAFKGEPPPFHEVNHKNGIKADCSADNLEYLTGLKNMEHASKTGLRPYKISNEGVRALRILAEMGVKQKDLAHAFGVSRGHVSEIVNNKERHHA